MTRTGGQPGESSYPAQRVLRKGAFDVNELVFLTTARGRAKTSRLMPSVSARYPEPSA